MKALNLRLSKESIHFLLFINQLVSLFLFFPIFFIFISLRITLIVFFIKTLTQQVKNRLVSKRMGIREIEVAGHKLIIHEQDNVYDSLTGRALTGAWLWDSAVILAHYMATHLDFQTKSVLELGAGAGLPGLTAARLGASRVVLTDVKPLLPGLINNVEANGLGDRVEVRELVWGSEESKQSEVGEFDFVLMSDVFFDPEEMVGLGKTLKSVCGSNTWICAVSEVRPWTGDCLNELVNQGFRVTELESKLGSGPSGEGKDNLDAFAVFQLIPPLQENCHETDIRLNDVSTVKHCCLFND